MKADGVEAGASIARRGLIPLMWCWGRLRVPPLIRWVWREGRLLVVSTVDVPIVDILGEVPHIVHPTVNVTHPSVHVMHVLGDLSSKDGEIGVHLNHLLIEHLVCDLALLESLRCLPGGLWCLRLRGHWRNKVGCREIQERISPCVEVLEVEFD
jgi:hypothetical protein